MASVKDLLLNSLMDLEEDDLDLFRWYIKMDPECIPNLEKADEHIFDTMERTIKIFGEEAVKIMVEFLRKINKKNRAEELEKKHKQAQAEGSIEGHALAEASSKPMEAQAEGSIEDPALVEASSNPMEVVTFTNIVPRTRNDFLQYSHQLTLDLNTVNKHLHLSESNRVYKYLIRSKRKIVITNTSPERQLYEYHKDRFDHYPQVLCRESVSDQHCYWEIEWSGDLVSVSVSYKSISRNGVGNKCWFGGNNKSWDLICSSSSYSFRHNNIWTDLPVKPIIIRTVNDDDHYRVGVYVDHSAGTLSFYSVSGDTMILIHTVQTTFIQPLYPGFRVYFKSSLKLC